MLIRPCAVEYFVYPLLRQSGEDRGRLPQHEDRFFIVGAVAKVRYVDLGYILERWPVNCRRIILSPDKLKWNLSQVLFGAVERRKDLRFRIIVLVDRNSIDSLRRKAQDAVLRADVFGKAIVFLDVGLSDDHKGQERPRANRARPPVDDVLGRNARDSCLLYTSDAADE